MSEQEDFFILLGSRFLTQLDSSLPPANAALTLREYNMKKLKANASADQGFVGGLLLGIGVMMGDNHPIPGMLFALYGVLIYLQLKCDI